MNSSWGKLAISIFCCLAIGWLGGLATESSVNTWYPTLNKPLETPPKFVFPIVWTFLYILMGISFWLVWMAPSKDKYAAFLIFALQLILNFLWSWMFFYLRSPILGLIDVSALWMAIFATIVIFWRHSKWAAYLLIPYLLWVSYAACLNAFIWLNN